MSKLKKCFFIVFIFVSSSCLALNKDTFNKIQVQVLPSAFYTPETRIGFGGIFYSYFNIGKIDSVSRKSNTQTYASITINKQFAFENDYQIWLKKNTFYLTGSIDYKMFPELFYGIGNETQETKKTMISFDLLNIHTQSFVRVYRKMYAGIAFDCQNLYNQDMGIKQFMSMRKIHGSMGYTAKGIGPIFMMDHRNNPLNPSQGSYLLVSYVDFKHVFKNQHAFVSFNLDARKYFTFFKKIVWNGNLYFSSSKGDVPFRILPEIGGARFLRGYYKGRFRDNNLIVIQHEFRTPIYKRFGIAAFGGLGSVANSISDFKSNQFHYNYGFGLRYKINKKENTNIRIDCGITKDSQGLYIVFAEAF